MLDWLVCDWPVGGLVGWITVGLVDVLIVWQLARLDGWLVEQLVGFFIGWLGRLLVD